MTEQRRRRLRFSVLFAVGALVVTWLVLAEGSPLATIARQTGAAGAWRVTVVPAYLVSAMISGNPHSPPMLLVVIGLFVQWAVAGYVLSKVLGSRRHPR